jgi:aubergine-like protein
VVIIFIQLSVTDINWNENPESTFDVKGQPKSYSDYYKERYNLIIGDKKQPLLTHKPSAREIRGGAPKILYLIPELCRATGINDTMRKDFSFMREMASRARKNPFERAKILLKFNRQLRTNETSAKIFKDNELVLGDKLVEFDARRMMQNKIVFGNNESVDLNADNNLRNSVDWTRCLQDKQLFDAKPAKRWALIFPESRNRDRSIDMFLDKFIRIAKKMGMQIDRKGCTIVGIGGEQPNDYLLKLEEFLGKDFCFIMIVVGSDRPEVYSLIKQTSLCRQQLKPVPIQVVVHRTIMKKSAESVAQKIAIQVNSKLGGESWVVMN